MTFCDNLATGRVAESHIARFMRAQGASILPVYEVAEGMCKGPQVFAPMGQEYIAPDMFCFNLRGAIWIEAKHKSAFTYHRLTERWTTGIDYHHYTHYRKISELSAWPVWLLFLHRENGQAKDSPPGCPSGLFGGNLETLSRKVNHMHENFGRSGGIFWAVDSLQYIASYADVVGETLRKGPPLISPARPASCQRQMATCGVR